MFHHNQAMAPSKKPGWINWRLKKNFARQMILEDLEPGGVLHGRDHLSATEVWKFYKNLPEFQKIVFNQFEERLKDHRQQAGRDREMANRDLQAMLHDRSIYLRIPHDSRGKSVIDMHPAKLLLRQDVEDEKMQQ